MPQQTDIVNQRSITLNEFAGVQPSWMIRNGIGLFFVVILGLIGCTWFISYPESIIVGAKINASNPPKEVLAKQGRLTKLFYKDGDTISQGAIIGYLETTANHIEVLQLSKLLHQIKSDIEQANLEHISTYWLTAKNNFTQLGDLQVAHQNFIQSFLAFNNYLASGFYINKKKILQHDLQTAKKLYNNLQKQQNLQQQDIDIAQQNYTVQEKLHKEELINDFEMRNQKSLWISKKMTIPQMESNIINTEAQQNNINKEMMELDKQTLEQKNTFAQAAFTYYNTVNEWINKNCIVSPSNGIIQFVSFVLENQPLDAGKPFCYITHPVNNITCELVIAKKDISKVKKGMEINLKFTAYPYQENGTVKAIINQIKIIPTDSGYIANALLPKGLTTNRNKLIPFHYGLQASGEIIMENKRLLEKIMSGLLKK